MELVQDLLLTASFALILSFIVAKLVAMAVAGRDSEGEFNESENAGEGVFMEVVRLEERLKVEMPFQGQRKVDFVGEVKSVDQFEEKPVHRDDQVEEPLQYHQESRELTEKLLEGGSGEESVAVGLPGKSSGGEEKASVEKARDSDRLQEGRELKEKGMEGGLGEDSVAIGIPEKSSDGKQKVSVEKASDSDRQHSENIVVKEIGAKSAKNDVVASQSEEVRAVACDEAKGKTHEVNEVKLDSCSDEDDWEGIEKSELDDQFDATVKSEAR